MILSAEEMEYFFVVVFLAGFRHKLGCLVVHRFLLVNLDLRQDILRVHPLGSNLALSKLLCSLSFFMLEKHLLLETASIKFAAKSFCLTDEAWHAPFSLLEVPKRVLVSWFGSKPRRRQKF